MGKPLYTEHRLTRPLPDEIQVCRRCKMGVVWAPMLPGVDPLDAWAQSGFPRCLKCGEEGEGERYIRPTVPVAPKRRVQHRRAR